MADRIIVGADCRDIPPGSAPELYPFNPKGARIEWMPAEIDTPVRDRHPLRLRSRGILYRFFDAERSLLYLGVTSWVWGSPSRWIGHEKSAEWWDLAAFVSIQFIPYDGSGRSSIEREAIRNERPRFNRQFNKQRTHVALRLGEGPKSTVEQLREALLPTDFADLVAAFKAEPNAKEPEA